MSEENNSKEELEGELLEIRKEIQWREREQDQNRETSHRWFISGIIILLFVLSFIIFGKDEWLAIIVWLIASCFLIIFAEKQFNKTGKGRRIKKADQELGELKRKRDELEKKLDLLEKKKKSKGKI